MKPYAPLGILYLSSHLRRRASTSRFTIPPSARATGCSAFWKTEPPATLGIYVNLMTRGNALAIMRARGGVRLARDRSADPSPPTTRTNIWRQARMPWSRAKARSRWKSCCGGAAAWSGFPDSGIAREDGAAVSTGPAKLLPDLDAQPWPDRERIDIEQYLQAWREHHGAGSVSVITARGCPYHCRWCSHSTFGKTHRRRSPAAVAEEVEWILDRYQPEMLWMADDVFTIHHGWLGPLRRRDAAARPAHSLRVHHARRPPEPACRRAAGRTGLLPRLDRLGERLAADSRRHGARRHRRAGARRGGRSSNRRGIQTGMFLMWGYEGEDLPDIEATFEHVKACRPDIFFTTVSYPIKGTPYYDEVAPKLVQLGGWRDSTDRDIRIRGRHSRRFYQAADELLRSRTAAEAAAARQGLAAAYVRGGSIERGGRFRRRRRALRRRLDHDTAWAAPSATSSGST